MVLFSLSIIIISGVLISQVLERFNLPHVTGYLVAGLLIGPSMLNLISYEAILNLSIVNDIALGFIAFSIGTELFLPKFKKIGSQVVVITLAQAILSAVLVALVVIYVFRQPLFMGLILGAIATATAPGPIMMVIKECKAKGPVVNTLLPLVAIDDALGIIIFGISLSLSKEIALNSGHMDFLHILIEPFSEIIKSLLIGGSIGVVLGFVMKRSNDKELYLSITTAAVLLGVSLAGMYHASPILLPMMIGIGFTNMVNKDVFKTESDIVDHFTPPILLLFYTMAGAELDIYSIKTVGLIGTAYVVIRAVGKIYGSYIGAVISKADINIKKYLGLTLLPQGGVAIGLSLAAKAVLPEPYGTSIKTIILAATVIYALVGPSLVKTALTKSGEVEHCDLNYNNVRLSVSLKAPFKIPKPLKETVYKPINMIKKKKKT